MGLWRSDKSKICRAGSRPREELQSKTKGHLLAEFPFCSIKAFN